MFRTWCYLNGRIITFAIGVSKDHVRNFLYVESYLGVARFAAESARTPFSSKHFPFIFTAMEHQRLCPRANPFADDQDHWMSLDKKRGRKNKKGKERRQKKLPLAVYNSLSTKTLIICSYFHYILNDCFNKNLLSSMRPRVAVKIQRNRVSFFNWLAKRCFAPVAIKLLVFVGEKWRIPVTWKRWPSTGCN